MQNKVLKKPNILALFVLFLLCSGAEKVMAQFTTQPFHQRTDFLLTSPSAMKFGLYGYDNPALLNYVDGPDFLFQFTDQGGIDSFNRFGLFTAVPNFGFSVQQNNLGRASFTSYSAGAGFGGASGAFGISYNWFGGDYSLMGLNPYITIGTITRPSKYFSIGLLSNFATNSNDYEAVADLGIRPFGSPAAALFADYAVQRGVEILEGTWSAGIALEPVDGIRLTGRYIHDFGITAGLSFSFGRAGLHTQSHLNTGGDHQFNSYGVRLGSYDRNVIDSKLSSQDRYLSLNLRGPMVYQTNRFFDNRNTLQNTLSTIRKASEDPRVAGIVVNTTGMQISPAMIWEIRNELDAFRATGRKVVMYIERGGMSTLHLTAAADYVVMDSQGGMNLPGFAQTTTYLKDLLDHYGIGVDEFREMTHKSALESLSRREGSPEDREQREDLINGYYEVLRRDITQGRNITEQAFDDLINNGLSLLPTELKEAGLVDTLARFSDINDVIRKFEDQRISRISSANLLANLEQSDAHWGEKPAIAVLYAIGGTQTEGGIQARRLASEIRSARGNDRIKAIVLRADSPGGDALASDLVAEELRKTMEEKPVIISMGNVAASGGYWISMYSDQIIVVPTTVTGSIGVISGWIYDDGLTDRLRLNYRTVSRGESADLFSGPSLPLFGLELPGRNLTERERERLISQMLVLYDGFIEKVAEGRDMSTDEVRAVAEGRVWTGEQAVENGLADEIGSLSYAIQVASAKAGLKPNEAYDIIEGPNPPAFDLFRILPIPSLVRSVMETSDAHTTMEDPMVNYLKMMIENNGQPSVALPLEIYQLIYQLSRY
ncbi:MAG: S49 family peptidase [Balneolales bacterium]|nr:S49 family peptidase [Balneolales bacterium]